ncbi:ChbG/HpnK family deacetylase [Pannonibacter sp. Pt2-lr]|uniref:ChbG/HpnK family deacetylase n=1 Tax=Pannonibacter anstelovis TaxID=3121537 RepID=A0ABU7ZJD1_9HYPH
MKRITLAAVDYGFAFGTDRAIRELLAQGRLSAVGCLAFSELWRREYAPLREVVDGAASHALVGLTLTLTGAFGEPMSPRWRQELGVAFRSTSWFARRAGFRLLPEEIILEEMSAQIRSFMEHFGAEPQFITLSDGLMRHRVLVQLLARAVEAGGLATRPLLVFPQGEGRPLRHFSRFALKLGFPVLASGPVLPDLPTEAELQEALRHHFDGLPEMAFVVAWPSIIDDRLRRQLPKAELARRERHFAVLKSLKFFNTLAEKDIFLY